ncbi:GIY-YIG nuclease family protein [Brevibacillus reuszeri]|uniref:GIY-YIG nuclease family protein n=1 Tax=Brevibacillus reuszeri TaxID=54915 RepID=UPI000CCBD8DC|nr:GIY-YIG nuclease family protein [Brevibacillus reuszeri]
MKGDTRYFWIRVFDYSFERDASEKGTLLDEFYLKDVERDEAKKIVRERYCHGTSNEMKFARPKKKDGVYAIVMDSDKYFYDRFYKQIDSYCFSCHIPLKGKASEFPREYIGEGNRWEAVDYDEFDDSDRTAYFCTYDCRADFNRTQRSVDAEGVFQEKEEGRNGTVFGYIYLIYNRTQDEYYIGQTRYLPFFRWQEHVKDGSKGDLSDLSFHVLAEVNRNPKQNDTENQLYLNNIEAWWISKYEHDGYKVKNLMKPRITLQDLKQKFNDMVLKQEELKLEISVP